MSSVTIAALIIFAATYVLMLALPKFRPLITVGSALIFVALGLVAAAAPDIFGADFFVLNSGESYAFSPMQALTNIDWNVIMMIAGTMGTVYLFIESKMPNLISDVLISKMPNVKWAIVCISLFAGIVSAFVDNVATVLMIAPVALAFCKKLNISPVPSIICISVSSNLQGAATLVGDTTSILLAKQANLDFSDFFVDSGKPGMFWVVEAGAIVSGLIILIMFRKENDKIEFNNRTKVEDKFPTFLLLGTVVALIAVSFIPYKDAAPAGSNFYKPDITNGIICIAFFLVGIIREYLFKHNTEIVKNAFKEIDYFTIVLLAGLFVVIGGIESAGVVEVIGQTIAKLGAGNPFLIFTIIVWISVLLSAFIDNIPYTATMLSIVPVIAASVGVEPKLLYYGLLCGATLGGNLTPIGASANITGIGILRKEGYEVKSSTFMKYSVPFTIAAVTTGYLMLWFIWG